MPFGLKLTLDAFCSASLRVPLSTTPPAQMVVAVCCPLSFACDCARQTEVYRTLAEWQLTPARNFGVESEKVHAEVLKRILSVMLFICEASRLLA